MRDRLSRLAGWFDPKGFLRFGLVGALNSLVDFAVFFCLDRWVVRQGPVLALPGGAVAVGPYLSNASAYAVATVHSFLWNRSWTFRKRGHATGREAGRCLLASLGCVAVSSAGLALCIRLLSRSAAVPPGWVNLLAKFPAACVTVFYNYFMNKFWVFRD